MLTAVAATRATGVATGGVGVDSDEYGRLVTPLVLTFIDEVAGANDVGVDQDGSGKALDGGRGGVIKPG
jgi:hypothetical protein